MSLVVNNNLMAANVARNLNSHYGRLTSSTQRLSSGLRVNTAADDAAGLAIRELQRADIAALQQGARNANDAISMIQVADGALGIVDEKLIRMKELAEQAATGTYDSTQRLMIESEYQAMAAEITRIANATDFNGTKLLDGTLKGDHDGSKLVSDGRMKIHFGTGNDSAEDYYYISIGECTAQAFGLGNESTWKDVQNRGLEAFKKSLEQSIKEARKAGEITDVDSGKLLAAVDDSVKNLNDALDYATDYKNAYKLWATDGKTGFLQEGKIWNSNSTLMDEYLATAAAANKGKATQKAYDDAFATVETALTKVFDDQTTAPTNTTLPTIVNDPAAGDTSAIKKALAQAKTATGLGDADAAIITLKGNLEAAWAAISGDDYSALYAAGTDTDKLKAGFAPIKDALVKALNNTSELKTAIQAKEDAAVVADKTTGVLDALKTAIEDKAEELAMTGAGGTYVAPATVADFEDWYAQIKQAAMDTATTQGLDTAGITALDKALDVAKAGVTIAAATGIPDATEWGNLITALGGTVDSAAGATPDADVKASIERSVKSADPQALEKFWNKLSYTQKEKLQYAWGQAAVYNLSHPEVEDRTPEKYGIGANKFGFVEVLNGGEDQKMLDKALQDMQGKIGNMDFAGFTVETQEDAQKALTAINNAIVEKDKIRAHLGATQNRLENTISNLNIQAENLQAAESRISDVDVATEMTQFVRNQILTQSAVAMLSQANSLPQMAMQLIGG